MTRRYIPLLATIVTFVASLTVYLLTLAPTVTFVDSGELAAVIATNGVSHPSGSPLYLLLGSLVAAIPSSSLIIKLNGFSAFCASISVALTCLAFFIAAENLPIQTSGNLKKEKSGKKKKNKKIKQKSPILAAAEIDTRIVVAGAIGAALSWMSSKSFWGTATVTEVYALNLVFVALLTLFLILYVRASLNQQMKSAWIYLGAATLTAGLAIANYPPFGIFVVVVLLTVYFVERAGLWKRWKRNAIMVAIFFTGLLPYASLAIRAGEDPLINWGNPSNWKNFWAHITAEQYRIFLGSPDLSVLKRIIPLWFDQWPVLLWVFWIPGIVVLWRSKRIWFHFTWIAALANILYGLTYNIVDVASAPSDFEYYFLPFFWISALWIGTGLSYLADRLKNWKIPVPWIVCLIPLIALATNWKESDRSKYTYAEDFVRSVLDHVAPNAFILTSDWTFVAPAMYLQHAENLRPDVVIYDGELLRRSWYFSYLRKTAPWLYSAARTSIDAFLVELVKYENKQPFDPQLTTQKYVAMLNHLLFASNRLNHPPYILLNLEMKEADPENYRKVESSLGRPPYFTRGVSPNAIGGRFRWVPETPAFRLYLQNQPPVLQDIRIPGSLFDPNQYYDNVTKGIILRYAEFLRWRGDYLRFHGDCPGAIVAYRKALDITELPEATEGISGCGALFPPPQSRGG